MEAVFKTNGRPVAPGNQKLGSTTYIWLWPNKNYNTLYKQVIFVNISGRLTPNFTLKNWDAET